MAVLGTWTARSWTDIAVEVHPDPAALYALTVIVDNGEGLLHLTRQAAESLSRSIDAHLAITETDAASDAFHATILAETQEQDR